MSPHLTALAFDRLLAGETLPSAKAHLDGCATCRERLEEVQRLDARFLQRFPSLEALPARQKRTAPPWWALSFAAVAAAAALLLFIHEPEEPGIRAKGGTIVELAVGRGDKSLPYFGQPLLAGDRLALRYTTDKHWLLLLSVEASGRVSQLLPASGERSMAITPGRQVQLEEGVELDDYAGDERFIALFSSEPLEAAAIVQEAQKRAADSLELPPLASGADEVTWVVTKERR